MGYQSFVHGQKGHYGVALLVKIEPEIVGKGFKNDKPEDHDAYINYWIFFKLVATSYPNKV